MPGGQDVTLLVSFICGFISQIRGVHSQEVPGGCQAFRRFLDNPPPWALKTSRGSARACLTWRLGFHS